MDGEAELDLAGADFSELPLGTATRCLLEDVGDFEMFDVCVLKSV